MTHPSPDLREIENVKRVLARTPASAADPEFRARLRARFVSAAVDGAAREPRVGASWAAWRLPALAALGAAAALVMAVMLNQGPAATLLGASGVGDVMIDGHAVAIDQPGEIARRLRPGAALVLPAEGQLDLELPGIALIQVPGGSRLTLPRGPGRWFGRTLRASLEEGEIRVATQPGFHGMRLLVETPEATAVVTGTTFAVLRKPDASCVCVLDGRVAMIGAASADTVRAGTRRSVFRDDRPALVEPILPMETMKLGMLRDRANPPATPAPATPAPATPAAPAPR